MSKLAIDGGSKVFETPAQVPAWPPVYPETAEALKEIYLGRNWSFYGPREVKFNEEFAKYTGAAYAVMMANGTVTLEVALKALGIGPGDEVIVPAHTWLATGEAVVYRGATPVIVDIEPDTLCLDPVKFEEAITPKTRAVIPVHLFGSIADMDRIMAIARKHDLKVIEDCAHAHGAVWNGKHVGTIGDVGSFSFQQSKLLASGEGGSCITNDALLWDKLGRMSHIGYPFGAKQGAASVSPEMGMICHNYRVTDFQAEILRSQLAHLKADTELRAKNAAFLRKHLNAIPGIRVQAAGRRADIQSYYMFAFIFELEEFKEGIDRAKILAALNAEGVGVGVGWGLPMYKQRLWSVPESMYRIASNAVTEEIVLKRLAVMGLNWLMLSQSDTEKTVEAFERVLTEYHR